MIYATVILWITTFGYIYYINQKSGNCTGNLFMVVPAAMLFFVSVIVTIITLIF